MVIVTIGLQRGFTGRFISRIPASSGVLPLLRLLQRQQAVTIISHVFRPPMDLQPSQAGPAPVAACGCVPPYPETRAYVTKILGLLGGAGEAVGGGLEVKLVE